MTTPPAVPLAAAASLWEPTPAGPYLNTATFGLPPRPTLEAVRDALDDWQRGEDAARARSTPPRAAGGCRWPPGDWDHLVCATYRWLLTPRGCAFLALRAGRLEELSPFGPGWFAGGRPRRRGARLLPPLQHPQDVDTALDALGC